MSDIRFLKSGLFNTVTGGMLITSIVNTLLTVLDSDGNSFSAGLSVLDSDGNSFTVTNSVLDSDGNSFTVV